MKKYSHVGVLGPPIHIATYITSSSSVAFASGDIDGQPNVVCSFQFAALFRIVLL